MNTDNTILAMPWAQFNQELMLLESEIAVLKLLTKEQKGKRRLAHLLRLYSRYNKLRSQREKSELLLVQQ